MTNNEIKLVMKWCLPIETTVDKLNELAQNFIDNNKEAINYSRCCETLPCNYAEGYNDAIAKIKEEAKYIEKQ